MSKSRTHKRQKNQEIEQQPAANLSTVPESVHEVLASEGQELDSETRAFMEPRFGHDFSQVGVRSTTPGILQTKSIVSEPGDEHEQEAERVTEQVMQMYDLQIDQNNHSLFQVIHIQPDVLSRQVQPEEEDSEPQQPPTEQAEEEDALQDESELDQVSTVAQQAELEAMLIEEITHLAEPPTTFLSKAYIGKMLKERGNNPFILQSFEAAIQQLEGTKTTESQDVKQKLKIGAEKLIHALEHIFIHDPQASTLDLLSDEKGQHYRNISWGHYDFPGNKPPQKEQEAEETKNIRLKHQNEARNMAADLSTVRPERRVNKAGKAAVMTESEFDFEYVYGQMQRITGQKDNHRLNHYALESFLRMRQAALEDGVKLIVLSSDRSPEKAKANSKRANNPTGVAKYSPHMLGLAIDFQMSQGKQEYKEINTRPMQNVINMHQSAVNKWLFLHGAEYGWYPYQNEPWHWEYNPPGFRKKFREDWRKSSEATPSPTLQRSASGPASSNTIPPIVYDALHFSGESLDASTRAFMEPHFGHDFSQVRIHKDELAAESARAVNARAYTVGNDVVFGKGQYDPETQEGKKLLAHELTHVVQQSGLVSRSPEIGDIHTSHEQEADDASSTILSGQDTSVNTRTTTAILQRQEDHRHKPALLHQQLHLDLQRALLPPLLSMQGIANLVPAGPPRWLPGPSSMSPAPHIPKADDPNKLVDLDFNLDIEEMSLIGYTLRRLGSLYKPMRNKSSNVLNNCRLAFRANMP